MTDILQEVDHRPWAMPSGFWHVTQQWHEVLFAHWPIDLKVLRPHVPMGLEIDTFDGQAWLAVVPFRMEGVRLRFAPGVPGTSSFPELNVRTYVKHGSKPGVWFLSLDASNALAVSVARAWFHLPYYLAKMRSEQRGGWIEYASERTHRGATAARWKGRYRGVGQEFRAKPGTLEYFLLERYCLYSAKPSGELLRAEIHHPPWDLQAGEAEFSEDSMAERFFSKLPDRPLLHYSQRQDMVAWGPQRA
jgi:uncharacterized protein YqjF (DUF2071 family)